PLHGQDLRIGTSHFALHVSYPRQYLKQYLSGAVVRLSGCRRLSVINCSFHVKIHSLANKAALLHSKKAGVWFSTFCWFEAAQPKQDCGLIIFLLELRRCVQTPPHEYQMVD